jgi:energy-converting hydrogenase Eha subunit C
MMLPGYLGLFNYRGYYQPPALAVYCLLLSQIPLTFAVLVSFLRGPVWRLRVTTSIASFAAFVWNDTATASIISLTSLLTLRLGYVVALVALIYLDLTILSEARWHGVGAIMILGIALAWNRLLNGLLSALEKWSQRRLLMRMCRGE